MQALAEPGTVVVTAQVQRQIAGLFVAEERGSHELKGVPEPVTLFRLVRASGAGRRAGQRHLTPLVGREEEIVMLVRRWERARQGDGQLVMIVGEPGLGKSRLIEEFHTRLGQSPHTWVEWGCSQLLQNTPLHPIAEWGRQRFGGAETAAEQQLADLENTLALIKIDPAENVPFLAPLLDIPLAKRRKRNCSVMRAHTPGRTEFGSGGGFKHALIQDAAYENLLKSRRWRQIGRAEPRPRDGVKLGGIRILAVGPAPRGCPPRRGVPV